MKNEEEVPRDIYERAFRFACRIVKLYRYLIRRDYSCRPMATQLLRAGTGIGANLAEARLGETRKDFLHKCRIAVKEASETHYWLRLFEATGIVSEGRVHSLRKESNEITAILIAIINQAVRTSKEA